MPCSIRDSRRVREVRYTPLHFLASCAVFRLAGSISSYLKRYPGVLCLDKQWIDSRMLLILGSYKVESGTKILNSRRSGSYSGISAMQELRA